MRTRLYILLTTTLAAALIVFTASYLSRNASAQAITYGTLDNFDVINDTGGDCHGFEIELEGITSTDVAYTFGGTYQRYGDPTVVPTATGVIIRYAATYDLNAHTWSATTPYTLPPYLPTQGHSCWTGGVSDPAQYYASGCDHFGASLNATPTKTTYRWLVESTSVPGTLTAYGTNSSLPAPVWNVTPSATPGGQPIAEAAIAPVPIEPGWPYEFGEAMWVKVYVTELPNDLHAEDLDHMVIDDPNVNIVPNEPVEIEFEWILLQASTSNSGEQVFGGAAEVGVGNEAVSRRFEFYKYAGQYDGETHEGRCDNPLAPDQQIPERCGPPDSNGVAGVGELIGAQNAAVNLLGPVVVIPENHAPVANPDSLSTDEDTVLTIAPGTLLGNDTDRDADLLYLHSVQNAVGGSVVWDNTNVLFTPTENLNGPASFTYTIDDGYLISTTTVYVTIKPVNDGPIANAGTDQVARAGNVVTLDGSASSDIDGNALTYNWWFDSVPLHSKAALSGATSAYPSFKADKAGTYVVKLVVNDGTVDSSAATVTITVSKGKK